MRVLVVLQAGDLIPSGVVRGLIYRDLFASHGITARYVNWLSLTLMRLLEPRSRLAGLVLRLGPGWLLAGLHRLVIFFKERAIARLARRHDVVYLSKILSYRLISLLRRASAARLVYDFGDAVWSNQYRLQSFPDILRMVDVVTTDNEYTAAYVREHNPRCVVIPDCPQVEQFDARRGERRRGAGGRVTVGWVGSPGTAYNLYVVWEALERLAVRFPGLQLRLVGVAPSDPRLPPFEKVACSCRARYSQAEMIEEVLGMDIGLFPLQDVAASQVRGFLKAAVYMAGEVPVVASPIGQSRDLIANGVTGLLARSPEEWEASLAALILDPALRERLGRAGLELVRGSFTVEHAFARLHAALTGTEDGLVGGVT